MVTEVAGCSSSKSTSNDSTLKGISSIEHSPIEDSETEENDVFQPNKRVKTGKKRPTKNNIKLKIEKEKEPTCEICYQKLNDPNLRLYIGHPNNAIDEYCVLLDPKLCLFNGDEEDISEADTRALNKITSYTVYDKNGHLCPFDSGLIDKNILIYFSGYVKPIYEEDPSIEGGISGKDFGPIVEWYTSGFDGGEKPVITFCTEIGDYVLLEPSEEYAPFVVSVREKSFLSKTIIEFLLDEEEAEYEDLLNKLQITVIPQGLPRFTQDVLLRHAQFICDQILSFDQSATAEDPLLIVSPCIRTLIDLAGISFNKGKSVRKGKGKKNYKKNDGQRGLIRRNQIDKKPAWTKATTTQLVNNMFENFFPDQLANESDKIVLKRRRCGVCESCQKPDCGVCTNCKNMIKFGGSGTSKQACIHRRCPNMEIQEANDEDMDDNDEGDEEKAEPSAVAHRKKVGSLKNTSGNIDWIGDPIAKDSIGTFYQAVQIESERIEVNDYIFVQPSDPTVPLQIYKIIYMYQTKIGTKLFHANVLWRGSETVLGETSNPSELFLVDECQEIPLSCVKCKTTVIHRQVPDDWADLGNVNVNTSLNESTEDITSFYYQKRYDPLTARFEDPLPEFDYRSEIKYRCCSACSRHVLGQQSKLKSQVFEKLEEKSNKEVIYGLVKLKDIEYRAGDTVYLQPGTFNFKYPVFNKEYKIPQKDNVDENIYPEYYRKYNDRVKGSNFDTPPPFDIGYILNIYAKTNVMLLASGNLHLRVKKLYRPENTYKSDLFKDTTDVNMVFWSEEECAVPFSSVVGKCYLAYAENLDKDLQEWSGSGPHRFYFTQMYDSTNEEFDDPPSRACNIGKYGNKSDKIKSKSKKIDVATDHSKPPEYPPVTKKLRALDVFAGCGGLSEGLHQSGVAKTHWAIELDESAASAFKLNNSDATVFTGDCNALLKKAMDGEYVVGGQALPRKGEVDLLCGGPPCQGFSGMNRFNSRAYSLFKNSLVVSLLSFCDYYRPKFFIMENVRNFVTFKKSLVLKLTLRCLLQMGYQCTFGILQAGNYGIPQTRRRMILIAAAPGEILPKFPDPMHVFSKTACKLSIVIDDKKYFPMYSWQDSAPFRAVTVKDALSDLPAIRSGGGEEKARYTNEPISHFQRKIRKNINDHLLLDHICKDLGQLVEARMSHIPTTTGADWRDLPNIVVRLTDGTFTNKLKYNYHDKKVGKSSTGALRGVCSCCTGKECNAFDRQDNTLIPWCLPHTANRHNNWAGLYGRVEWDGYFSTTITNPEPMGKQGRVLHPDQTRVVSVRECARSQGFQDSFRFYGNIQDKHRQVGNAVPPPLAAAIGLEIRKCLQSPKTNGIRSQNDS